MRQVYAAAGELPAETKAAPLLYPSAGWRWATSPALQREGPHMMRALGQGHSLARPERVAVSRRRA
jgi:hypothetical protein